AGGAAAPGGGCADDAGRGRLADGDDAPCPRRGPAPVPPVGPSHGRGPLHAGNRQAGAPDTGAAEKSKKNRWFCAVEAGVLRPAQNVILILLFEGNDLLMRKTMNIWVLIAMSACVLVAFFWYSGTLSQSIDELNDTYDQTQMRLTELQGEQADLKTQLETVGTDAFIENQARTMYGY